MDRKYYQFGLSYIKFLLVPSSLVITQYLSAPLSHHTTLYTSIASPYMYLYTPPFVPSLLHLVATTLMSSNSTSPL